MKNITKQLDEKYIMHTYGRFDVSPDHGTSSTIIDEDGTEYIDFTSGIGVNSIGIADAGWVAAVTGQLNKIQHISNYYYSASASKLAEKLITHSGMKKVFFANSGAEANEGAIKLARKYSYDKYGEGRSTIVTICNSFHGRTVTTLAATAQDSFHTIFYPFTEGFKYCPADDIDALKEALTDDVCALMFEPIQGEGGVNEISSEFVMAAKALCDKKDILIVLDEVQTGVGRLGKLYGFMYYDFIPDILTSAKGLGGGLPIGAFLASEKCADTLEPGQHGSTFGANPAVAAGACYVIDKITSPGFLDEVIKKGEYFREKIAAMNIPAIKSIRGKGLMIGIQVSGSPKDYAKKAADMGLLVLTAGRDVIRFLPPLTITYDEIDRGLAIFRKIFN